MCFWSVFWIFYVVIGFGKYLVYDCVDWDEGDGYLDESWLFEVECYGCCGEVDEYDDDGGLGCR